MYTRSENCSLDLNQTISFPTAGMFALSDRQMVQIYIEKYAPMSCEYNFANLFCWQEAYQYSWRLYKGRLVIYDGVNQCAFMPLGESLPPDELAGMCRELLLTGLEPCIGLVPDSYLNQYPGCDHYFSVTPERDYAEYIYSVDSLCQLNSTKLHKKKNLISQFERLYPAYEIKVLSKKNQDAARAFSRDLLDGQEEVSHTLEAEFMAMEKAFDNFADLGLEGLALMVDDRMAAFSIFSPLNPSTYNVQFEKSDFYFKGAAQVINQQTALFLQDKCQYINREQDLGIKGLRQAKMSYEPEKLLVPHTLSFRRS